MVFNGRELFREYKKLYYKWTNKNYINKLETNYNIGKKLAETGKHNVEGIVKKYACILTKKFGSGYKEKDLYKQSYYLKILALMYFIGKKKVASTIRK